MQCTRAHWAGQTGWRSRVLTAIVLFLASSASSWARPSKDIIRFTNGDRMTCEIIKLQRGYLYVNLPYADGTVALDWSKVAHIESEQGFIVADNTGRNYDGGLRTIAGSGEPKNLTVGVGVPPKGGVIQATNVVGMRRMDESFWTNLNGAIDSGVNFSKQEDRVQYTFQANAAYDRTRWSAGGSYQSDFSGGGGGDSSLRNDLLFTGTHQLRSPNHFAAYTVEFLQSNAQQLDLRTTTSAALGRVFSKTNHSFITAYAGLVWDRERFAADPIVGQSAEALIGTQLNFFTFKNANALLNARVYPSLTEPGRVRFNMNTALTFKVARDLYWRFSYFLDSDSQPPMNFPKTDYGSSSSLGWSF